MGTVWVLYGYCMGTVYTVWATVVKRRRKSFIEANRKLSKKQTDAAQHNRDVNQAYKCNTDRLWSERAQKVDKASTEETLNNSMP